MLTALEEFPEEQIDITASPYGFNKNIPDALQQLVESISSKRQILLEYQSLGLPANKSYRKLLENLNRKKQLLILLNSR